MSHPSSRFRAAAVVLLLASSPAALRGHDFWIEPSTFSPAPGETVRIHLRVGEHFAGEPVARDASAIERFVVAGAEGDRPVPGRAGMDPAGLLRLESPGWFVVGYRSRPSHVELDAGAFDDYLREEGLERIAEDRAARQESTKPGRETFSRSVKALLRVGTPAAGGHDRVLGMTLELVPLADPARAPDGRLPVRLLHEGAPLSGALVIAYRKTGADAPAHEVLRARSDSEGRVLVPVTPGTWLVKAVHMQRARDGGDADWDSVWSALTFQVPAPAR